MQVLASVVIEAVRSILVITRNKIPTSWLNNSNFNLKHNMLKHSLLQHEEKVQRHYKTQIGNTTVQQRYKGLLCTKATI
jgi:hypothetical protein